ncbi:MAG: SurA N-terminal domain-containing protein [Burkholderiales bacterium]|nr:SurA N-terminal domain-containing protein [Burkholderiales bacterium]
MFDYIRNHTRLMGFLLALFIVPAFVLVGVDGYSNMGGRGETVAVVAGVPIKKDAWDAAHRAEVDRMRSSQPNLDLKLFDSDEARYATLERMVRDLVLATAVQKSNLITSDQKLARDLQANEAIAALRKPDGTLDVERYRQLLAAQGMSPAGFEAQMRQDLSQQQVLQAVTASSFAPPTVADVALKAFFERREVQWLRLDPATFRDQVKVTDDEVAAYFNANPAQFQAPEQADVQYVVLDLESVTQGIAISDADLKAYYEQNASRYSTPEERRASHILITTSPTAPAAEREAAKAKATELLAQLRSKPDTFASVAKQHSQDPGSATSGGDLSFFQRGAMVKPFEDAAFALAKGDISEVVESEFGYHIIQLTDIRPSAQRPLEAVKGDILAELKRQLAQKEFAAKAEQFGNMVYEQSDSLAPVVERLQLKLQTADAVGRTPNASMPRVLANAKLLDALFSADSIEKKLNTESVEVGPNQLVSARVVTHRPAHTLALSEVSAQVRERLVAQKSQDLAREAGEKSLAAGKAGESVAKLSALQVVSRDKPLIFSPKELSSVLGADMASAPAWIGVDLGARGYGVYKVVRVLDREAPPAEIAAQELQQYTQWWGSAEGVAYLNFLKKRFKADIKVPRPAPLGSVTG